ncbi:ABC transporter permease [Flexithrix dorotheae]|uniref:ABC transporter permease n=1 Tax=Flexithrix dorotheae TaxID=70993 RepID=UPI0003AAFD4A|nr:ABC transporter permease [Flexithrix dorotheae]
MKKEKKIPPKLANRFLHWFLRDDLAEEVEGDLEEQFLACLEDGSLFKAKLNYCYQVLNYLRPFAIRNSNLVYLNQFSMFKNYFKIGWRNLFKNKGYSFINIGGLAMGMAVAMLIGLWVYDELTFNKYHENYDQIAKVMQHTTANDQIYTGNQHPFPLSDGLKNSYSEDFKYVVSATEIQEHIITNGEKNFNELGNYMQVDGPEMLSLQMIKGHRYGLENPNSILISRSLAERLFSNEDPLNKIIKLDNRDELKITGVYQDVPKNSTFHELAFIAPWDLFLSSNPWTKPYLDKWGYDMSPVYVQLHPNAEINEVNHKIKDIINNNVGDEFYNNDQKISLHPMDKWHLYEEFSNGENIGGNIRFVWLFSLIGIFVLLLACINFMNLSTARSESRTREVGIRKAIGSLRSQLIYQFFSESILVVIFSFVIALALVTYSLPWFNEVANKGMEIPWTIPLFWMTCIGFILLTGILAGCYPAIYLSSFQAIKALKGAIRSGHLAIKSRQLLVVFQFTISVILIIGTIIVYRQIQYTKDRPVGYNRERLISVNMRTNDIHDHFEVIRNQLLASGTIVEMSESSCPLNSYCTGLGNFDWAGKDPEFLAGFSVFWTSPEYGKTIGWKLLDGRDFSREIASDQRGMVINQTAVKYMGLENPVGQTIRHDEKDWTILGVVDDLIVGSPYESVRPSIYMLAPGVSQVASFRFSPEISTQVALERIESIFKEYAQGVPFEYQFADKQYAKKFNNEVRIGKLSSVFSILAILISCLGLLGLSSFTAEKRTKEIGIRKVLGASTITLWKLLSKEFIILVILSCIIAIPFVLYFSGKWLENYEYRTNIPWWIFAYASLGAVLITLLTISYQAVKAALMNPVKSLRSE